VLANRKTANADGGPRLNGFEKNLKTVSLNMSVLKG
jgi:hypothetical protein